MSLASVLKTTVAAFATNKTARQIDEVVSDLIAQKTVVLEGSTITYRPGLQGAIEALLPGFTSVIAAATLTTNATDVKAGLDELRSLGYIA